MLEVEHQNLSFEARCDIADHVDVCDECLALLGIPNEGSEVVTHKSANQSDAGGDATHDTGGERPLPIQPILDAVERLRRRQRGPMILREATSNDARTLAARPRSFDPLDGQLAAGRVLRGSRVTFTIRRLIGTGDFTETYLSDCRYDVAPPPGASMAALKIPRLPDEMSPEAATTRLKLLSTMIQASAHDATAVQDLPGVAKVIDSGHYDHRLLGHSVESTFIAYQYVEGGLDLVDYLTARYSQDGHFSGVPTVAIFAKWARLLTTEVLNVHARRALHGDLTPRNIIVAPDGRPVLIDMGQSIFREVMHNTNDFSRFFYRAPEGVTDPTSDLRSLGGVLYFIATGKEPIGFSEFTDIETLKQHVSLKINQANPRLFQDDIGVADIVAMCLRTTGRVEHACQLLAEIDTFWPETPPATISGELSRVAELASALEANTNALYRSVAASQLRSCGRLLSDLSQGVYDVTGSAREIRRAAYALLRCLDAGDEFITVSIPEFWRPSNIGINGRFLTMCRNAAARGATVRRVFLLDEAFRDDYLESIVSAQLAAAEHLEPGDRQNFVVRYVPMPLARRRRAIAEGKHFGLLVTDGCEIAMFPVYNTSGDLVTLRFRTGRRHVEGLRDLFESIWREASSLTDLKLPTSSMNIDLITSDLNSTDARSSA